MPLPGLGSICWKLWGAGNYFVDKNQISQNEQSRFKSETRAQVSVTTKDTC